MTSVLDRPIWTALTTRQREFGLGTALARRFRPEVLPFAATETDDSAALMSLADLAHPGETLLFLMVDPIALLPGFEVMMTADAVQMIAEDVPPPIDDSDLEPLGPDDAEAMLALAKLTRPGPFSLKSQMLGRFWGIRQKGRLAAMAGERMKQPGFVELSGVCTHPDFRGTGYARRLSQHVATQILKAGDRPYLHAYTNNHAAVALYQSIGFVLRSTMHVAALRKTAAEDKRE